MAAEKTIEQQIAELKNEIALLTQQQALLKVQADLNAAQAQQPFAMLQGIKAGTAGLTLPTGKEGTLKVAKGTEGTMLLRAKRPMLELLDAAADEFIKICPSGAVLLTEAQMTNAYTANYLLSRIDEEISLLEALTLKATPAKATTKFMPAVIAGAYGVGMVLDTINSLAKLLRTNREMVLFGDDEEALKLLGYMLEAKGKGFIAAPALAGDLSTAEARVLLNRLSRLAEKIELAKDAHEKIAKTDSDLAARLKAEIAIAGSILEGLSPEKKREDFLAQISGQVIFTRLKERPRLLVEAKAQVVQVTESRWYASDRIISTGELQLAYRLLRADGIIERSGVILKASSSNSSRIDDLGEMSWQRP